MRLKLILKTRFIKVMITDKFESHIHVVLGGEIGGRCQEKTPLKFFMGGGDVKWPKTSHVICGRPISLFKSTKTIIV